MRGFKLVLKWAMYVLLFFLLFAIQSSVGYRAELFGARTDFALALVLAVALREDKIHGGVFAVFAGAVCDLFAQPAFAFYTVIFFVSAEASAYITEKYMNKGFPVFLLCFAASAVLSAVVRFFGFYMLFENITAAGFAKTSFFELVLSVLLCPIPYFSVCAISRIRVKKR